MGRFCLTNQSVLQLTIILLHLGAISRAIKDTVNLAEEPWLIKLSFLAFSILKLFCTNVFREVDHMICTFDLGVNNLVLRALLNSEKLFLDFTTAILVKLLTTLNFKSLVLGYALIPGGVCIVFVFGLCTFTVLEN